MSTIEQPFLSHKSLFEDLDIYDKWEWDEKYPVVRLSFGNGKVSTPEAIERRVIKPVSSH
ncbi:MAG: AAA family ATPase [Proteobacteria bacterium]|nr:AAA family ATPase [Pseudomonadota bacterium]